MIPAKDAKNIEDELSRWSYDIAHIDIGGFVIHQILEITSTTRMLNDIFHRVE